MLMKTCTSCHELKDESEFHINRSRPDGRHYYCKECQKKRTRAYYQKNPEKILLHRASSGRQEAYYRQWAYGLSGEDYKKLWDNQKGLCGVCKKLLKKPVVDHCHESGRVRGLLCRTCNSGLGMLGDTVDALKAAIKYLTSRS